MKQDVTKQSFPWQKFLAPKFWPSWLGLGGMRILAMLPYRLQLMLGKLIGEIFYHIAGYRREIAQTNIRLCFPELSTQQQQQLVRDHFHAIGMTISETALCWWGNEQKLRKLVKVSGFEHIDKALQQGTGAIVLGAHYTTVEISGRLITLDHKFAVTYQKLRNPLFDQMTLNRRISMFDQVFSRSEIRPTFRYIKNNNLMWIASDQDAGIDNSVFVPFFGQITATQTVPSRMAKITKAPIIPYISRRLDNAKGYEIIFYPPLENFPGESLEADAIRINQLLEQQIRKAPEQYLWVHRRFKTRPEGEAKLYRKKPRRVKKQ